MHDTCTRLLGRSPGRAGRPKKLIFTLTDKNLGLRKPFCPKKSTCSGTGAVVVVDVVRAQPPLSAARFAVPAVPTPQSCRNNPFLPARPPEPPPAKDWPPPITTPSGESDDDWNKRTKLTATDVEPRSHGAVTSQHQQPTLRVRLRALRPFRPMQTRRTNHSGQQMMELRTLFKTESKAHVHVGGWSLERLLRTRTL